MPATISPVAFRCNKCWQLTCSDSDQAGNSVPCLCCSSLVVVPEATSDFISAGEEFVANQGVATAPKINLEESFSPQDIDRIVAEKLVKQNQQKYGVAALVCSRWKRFVGGMIDYVLVFAILLVSGLICIGLGFEPEGQGVILFCVLPALLGIVQTYLITFEGRTIGKYFAKSKIVDSDGQPPGFFRGVVLRIVVVGLLGFIPMFGIANISWVFGHDRRCLHDLIASTYVIDA